MAITFTTEELQYIIESIRENPDANLDTILAHMEIDMQMVSVSQGEGTEEYNNLLAEER